MFVFVLCKVQTVGFEKLDNAFDTRALLLQTYCASSVLLPRTDGILRLL
jgi:hypothetical protein